MLCRYMAERKIGEDEFGGAAGGYIGAITLPLPKDSRLFQGNLGGGMKRHDPGRVVGRGTRRRHASAITEAARRHELCAARHFLTRRLAAVFGFGIKLHLNRFRIEVVEINLHLKIMPWRFSFHSELAEAYFGPVLFDGVAPPNQLTSRAAPSAERRRYASAAGK